MYLSQLSILAVGPLTLYEENHFYPSAAVAACLHAPPFDAQEASVFVSQVRNPPLLALRTSPFAISAVNLASVQQRTEEENSEVVDISDDEDFPIQPNDLPVTLKCESLDYDFPPENTSARPANENVASSSGSNLRSSFLGMGFMPALVDKAIEEHGEENAELLLETLFAYSNHQQPKPEPFHDGLSSSSSDDLTAKHHVKEEPDTGSPTDGKKESLLKMNFTVDEVELAMDRLGKHAAVGQLMDFIFATRMAKKYEKDASNIIPGGEESEKDCSNEVLFGVMEKTLQLLEMGFSENEISTAFEKCGSEAPLPEIANSIVDPTYQYRPPKRKSVEPLLDLLIIKTEEHSDITSYVGSSDSLGKSKRKIPRTQLVDEPNDFRDPKEEFAEETASSASQTWLEAPKGNLPASSAIQATAWKTEAGLMENFEEDSKPSMYISTPNPCRTLSPAAARPPYFLYGHVTSLSHSSWAKISQFLYSVQPEFANTELHSALRRQEGYVHNLPTDDRAHILPRGPLTIQEASPQAGKWWPAWDTRKHLTQISCQTGSTAHLIDRLARALDESDGPLSRDLVQQLHSRNLVWMGRNRVGPVDPELVERVMGYPQHHTRVAGLGPDERIRSLGLAFQTDTLGYRLSVLRRVCPGGVTVLSFFTGIGGPEVALHRLGIRMKGVVSVEASEVRRRVVRRWWENSGQGGELVQIDDVKKVTGGRLDELSRKFGGFDLVVCQNPSSEPDGGVLSGLDFSMFVEFVRVLQRVRLSR
ncbi:S-adenosyl-L-methionine-dependent methyltransferases superfamily protein [Striga hermonthica]|uniref:S-adenosyl-L-methionine-dependent methyltransferases superfamily protein n=1 Tax=Striga hermonthica TaxID=68872 RepID=A0A9N7NFD4_STRHE|nr:S-adenosyl-L-methionine-dependent methyltransferases superfamily protein [Striga hermonthica]